MTTTMNTPRMSIVMVDGGFRESYHAIDFFCQQSLPAEDYELIWVEYYDTVNPALAAQIAKYPNARVITLNRSGVYHSSYCFNAGIAASRAELILIPDADLVVEPDMLQAVWEMHQTDERLVMYLFRYEELEAQRQAAITLEHLQDVCVMKSPSNFGACLTVRKKWLTAINGYEQHPVFGTGFHANGQDVNTRFKNLGLPIMWHPHIKLYHPWHPFTKAADDAYNRQLVVIRYRAVNLLTHAFEGLDPAHAQAMPEDLVALLAEKEREIAKAASKSADEELSPSARPAESPIGRALRALKVIMGKA